MGRGISKYFNSNTKGMRFESILLSAKSNGFTPRKDKRHGSNERQPQGSRERNVGHPNGEEHSRNAKGNRGPRVNRIVVTENIGNGLAVIGTSIAGYAVYRGLRMLPSLAPPLWWTIPINISTP